MPSDQDASAQERRPDILRFAPGRTEAVVATAIKLQPGERHDNALHKAPGGWARDPFLHPVHEKADILRSAPTIRETRTNPQFPGGMSGVLESDVKATRGRPDPHAFRQQEQNPSPFIKDGVSRFPEAAEGDSP